MENTKKFPIKVTLEDPVEFDGRTYTELQFRKMKGKDALVAENEKDQLKSSWLLYAALSGVPWEVFAEMSMDDMEAVVEQTVSCMGKSAAAEMARANAERDKLLSQFSGETS